RPTTSSDSPAVYTLAVSMKLPPAPRKASTMRRASVSSHGAVAEWPNIIAPRHARGTGSPEWPRVRYSIVVSSSCCAASSPARTPTFAHPAPAANSVSPTRSSQDPGTTLASRDPRRGTDRFGRTSLGRREGGGGAVDVRRHRPALRPGEPHPHVPHGRR